MEEPASDGHSDHTVSQGTVDSKDTRKLVVIG